MEYDKLEGDVAMAKNNLLEQLETLGSPQVRKLMTLPNLTALVLSSTATR